MTLPEDFEVEVDMAPILMAMGDGRLSLAHQDGLTLNLWSRPTTSSDGFMTWNKRRTINLEKILPIQNLKQTLSLIGYMEGSDIVFVMTDLGINGINLKSRGQKKIWKKERLCTLVPYMSFYDPRGIFISDFFCELGTSHK